MTNDEDGNQKQILAGQSVTSIFESKQTEKLLQGRQNENYK